MEQELIPVGDNIARRITHMRPSPWRARLPEKSVMPHVKWYTLRFDPLLFSLAMALSASLPLITPFISSGELHYGSYVGLYLFLLSLAILLPVAFRANTAGGPLPFPAAPWVGLNFLYFVLGTLALLAYPSSIGGSLSLPAVPAGILVLALGFAFLAAGIVMSGWRQKTWVVKWLDTVTVGGMGVLVAVAAGAVWGLRLFFATQGYGITHMAGGGVLTLPRHMQPLAQAMVELQHVPVCLCLARLCNSRLPPRTVRAWQTGLAIVLLSNVFYCLMAGRRLELLSELLIVVSAMWLRIIPRFSRRWYAYTGLLLALAVPVVYAQREVLSYVSPHVGENQLVLLRDDLVGEQAHLLQGSAGSIVGRGFTSDIGRFTAVGPPSAVVGRLLNDHYPLMWGETLIKGLPFVVPRAFWPSKPVQENVDILIEDHFGLEEGDDLTTMETESLANFGIMGLVLWMFLFGVLINKFLYYLVRAAPAHEPATFCLLYALPTIFLVETDIGGALVGVRLVFPLFLLLRCLSVRGRSPA
jgi:hypothetical protein